MAGTRNFAEKGRESWDFRYFLIVDEEFPLTVSPPVPRGEILILQNQMCKAPQRNLILQSHKLLEPKLSSFKGECEVQVKPTHSPLHMLS